MHNGRRDPINRITHTQRSTLEKIEYLHYFSSSINRKYVLCIYYLLSIYIFFKINFFLVKLIYLGTNLKLVLYKCMIKLLNSSVHHIYCLLYIYVCTINEH